MRMICLLVPILIVPAFSELSSAQIPYNTPISSVEIEGDGPEMLEGIGIGSGDTLSPAALRSAIQSLYDRGGYGRIEVSTFPDPDGTRLVFDVEPPYFFATIRLEPERLLDRSVSSYLGLPYGQRFSRAELDRIVSEVARQLEAEGYFSARIEPSLEFDPNTRLVTTTIAVEEGPRARVGNFSFTGQETFSSEELLAAIDIAPGDRYLGEDVADGLDSIESLFADLGFLDTRVEVAAEDHDPATDTVELTIAIESGRFLQLAVEGYELSDERREELLPIYEERSIDADLIDEGAFAILEYLRRDGYLQATVSSRLFEAPFDDASQVTYAIDTGERSSVREVRIEGNSFFTSDILHERIGISRQGLFSRGVYSPELLDEAAETIRGLYRASGFAGAAVTTEVLTDADETAVTIRIDEGDRLVIGNVFLSGASEFDDGELAALVNLAPGASYTEGLVQGGRRAISSSYHSRGYDEVRVESAVVQSGEDRIDIEYQIVEGSPSVIRQILVSGNTRTQEKIVHRNSGIETVTPYDPEAILDAQRQLYATGLFNRVDIVPLNRPASGERDLLIQLEDAGPVVLTYGVGAQDREGIRGTVEVTHSNLWGLDRSISTRIRGSRREQRFQTTYREPRLFNWELDGFASLFMERARQTAFDASRVDFSFQSLKQFANRDNLLLSVSYQTVNLRDIRDNRRTEEFPDEEGIIQIARLGSSYIRDTRDDILNPSRGNFFTGTFQFASTGLGSEVNFTSLFTQFSIFRPAKQAVIAASARFGWNQPFGRTLSLPITERYFAGGSTTLRGFGLDNAGALAGGNALTILNAEYRFPIPFLLSGFGGTIFYDTGTVFERISHFNFGDYTHTLGFGFRYRTPLGPIRVDFGFNVNRQPGDSGSKTFFTLGHAF